MFRNIGKQMVLRLSALVARNELFERYGERPTEPALPPGAWSGSKDVSEATETEESGAEDDEDEDEANPVLRSPVQIKAGLQSGPMVVNHWATWCESCSAEKDAIRALSERIDVPMVGISWDAFEGADPATALADVDQCRTESRLQWTHWVIDGTPQAFFDVFPLDNKSVPQTWVVNGRGEVVYCVDGTVGAREADEIVRQLGQLG